MIHLKWKASEICKQWIIKSDHQGWWCWIELKDFYIFFVCLFLKKFLFCCLQKKKKTIIRLVVERKERLRIEERAQAWGLQSGSGIVGGLATGGGIFWPFNQTPPPAFGFTPARTTRVSHVSVCERVFGPFANCIMWFAAPMPLITSTSRN